MVAGLVPDQNQMDIRSNLLSQLFEEGIDGVRIEIWSQESGTVAGLGTNRRQNIEIIVLSLPDGPRPRADRRPDACQRALLAKASFVLEPDFYSLPRMVRGNLRDPLGSVFLKVSCAAGSASRCCGRGIRSL